MRFVTTKLIRKTAGTYAAVATLPAWIWFEIQSNLLGRTYACMWAGQYAAHWSGMLGVYFRRALFKHVIAKLGEQVSVNTGTILTKTTIELGNFVYIGSYCVLGDVRIGDNSLVADHVCIISGHHGTSLDSPMREQPEEYRTINVGTDSWIGSGSMILADVGDHCIVGAGSVVTKPVFDYLVVAGNPAKPIKDRRDPATIS